MVLATAFLCLAGAAHGAPNPERLAARTALQEDVRRLRRVTVEAHKELLLIRDREKSGLRLTKASAASPETMHLALLEVREKSRRERLALRTRSRAERERLRRLIKGERERVIALRGKK
jgi:hypothetical protein